ncbi:hypothetical protein [Gymnodinialimonas ulvae]|uniref:hypothetical protein n=1 Tax=Gymnodinialimonas ulvae TaxID=3126504 RepID=UPI0030A4A373
MAQILQVLAIGAVTFGTGAATMTVMNEDIPDLQVPEGAWIDSGALDGMTFDIHGTDLGSGAALEDELVFRDGTFMSVDCQNYCDFGWSEYQTKEIDGVIHFTATTLCPDAPHTVVFHGRVDATDIVLDATWTTRRWYWTNQIEITATGTAVPSDAPAVSG